MWPRPAPQGSAFDHRCPQSAADRVDACREPGRSSAHYDHVRFNQVFLHFGNENRLLLKLLQRHHEQFLGLRPVGDQDIVCKSLRDAERGVAIRDFLIGLNIDYLKRNKIGPFYGSLYRIDRLVRAIGAGGANKDLDLSF